MEETCETCKLIINNDNMFLYTTVVFNLYPYIQLLDFSKDLVLHQADPTSTNINYYEYMWRHHSKTCKGTSISNEGDYQNSQ